MISQGACKCAPSMISGSAPMAPISNPRRSRCPTTSRYINAPITTAGYDAPY